MPKTDRHRALYVLKYLWEHSDEEHPVTLVQLQNHLSELGIDVISKTSTATLPLCKILASISSAIAAPSISFSSPAGSFPPLN